MKTSVRYVGQWSLELLLFLTLTFPVVLGPPKLFLLITASLAGITVVVVRGCYRGVLHKEIALFLWLGLTCNAAFVFWGAVNGSSVLGVIESFKVYIAFPIAFGVLTILLCPVVNIRRLTLVLIASSAVISLETIWQSLRVSGFDVPGAGMLGLIYPGIDDSLVTFLFSGEVGYMPRAMERLLFLAPFSIGLLLVSKNLGIPRIVVFGNAVLVLIAVAASERRVFALIGVVGIFVAGAVWVWSIGRKRPAKMITCLGAACIAILVGAIVGGIFIGNGQYAINGGILERAVNSYSDLSFEVRITQLRELLHAASYAPFAGQGFGSDIHGFRRSETHPWRFELTYVALIFQVGALGLLLYMLVLAQLFIIVSRALRTKYETALPYIFGLSGFLVALGTNPYHQYGTGQLLFFLPIFVINWILLHRRAEDRMSGKVGSCTNRLGSHG